MLNKLIDIKHIINTIIGRQGQRAHLVCLRLGQLGASKCSQLCHLCFTLGSKSREGNVHFPSWLAESGLN